MIFPNNYSAIITRRHSQTFFWSTLLFPKEIRQQVFDFYAFVRTVDDFVDTDPPQKEKFFFFKRTTLKYFKTGTLPSNPIIAGFLKVVWKNKINLSLIKSFFLSQQLDLKKKRYRNYRQLEKFIYGVAEVIGLSMAKILHLPVQSYKTAQLLGKAMQLINCVRDIAEDKKNGKLYLPLNELKKFKLTPDNFDQPQNRYYFHQLIRFQLKRALQYEDKSRQGFKLIPKRYLMAVKTAADLYRWTAQKIFRHPEIVLVSQLKPNKLTILKLILLNFFQIYVFNYFHKKI